MKFNIKICFSKKRTFTLTHIIEKIAHDCNRGLVTTRFTARKGGTYVKLKYGNSLKLGISYTIQGDGKLQK